MPLTFALVERTPYRLRYTATSPGEADGADTDPIPNVGGATPDLSTDAAAFTGSPIWKLVTTAAASTAAARELLQGDGLTAVADVWQLRGRVTVYSRTGEDATRERWIVDCISNGTLAEVNVTGPDDVGTNFVAYIEIEARHSYDV